MTSRAAFEMLSPDDRSAEAESKAVNQILMEDNNGYQLLYVAAKDAALFKNCIGKVQCIEEERVEVREFDGLDDEQAALLELEYDEVKRDGRNGKTTARRSTMTKRIVVEVVEPANFAYPANWHKHSFEDAPFVQERCIYTRTELLEMGYPAAKVAALKPYNTVSHGQQYAKNLDKQSDDGTQWTRDQEKIEVFETYLRIAMDGGDKGELWRVVHAEREVLEKTPAQRIPYVGGCLYLTPHRFAGESLYEKLRPLQDGVTGLTRSLMDSAQQNANLGLIVSDLVNPSDLGDRAVGQDVRCEGDVRAAAMPIPVMDMSAGTLAAIEKFEQLASKRAGASLDLQTGEVQGLEKVTQAGAVATTQMIGHQELQAATITRTFSETFVSSLFKLIHDTMREEYDQPVQVMMAGQLVPMDAGQWPERTRINVKTGMSPGERNRKLASLGQMMQVQLGAMQQGMALANPQTFHALLLDYMKAADLDGGERYFVDPMSPEYQQVEQAMAQQMAQQQQLAAQMEQMQHKVEVAIAEMKDQTDRLKIAADLEIAEAKNVTEIGTAEISARASALGANGRGSESGSDTPAN